MDNVIDWMCIVEVIQDLEEAIKVLLFSDGSIELVNSSDSIDKLAQDV